MALFVYLTDNCLEDAQNHSLINEVERFRERVEKTQSTSLFDPFPAPYLVKKKLGGRQGRLIATLQPIGEHAVIVFLAILIRGSRDYDEFKKDPIGYGQQHFDDLFSGQAVSRLVEERLRKSPLIVKPNPTEEEYAFLYGAFVHHQSPNVDDLICETQEWVERVNHERISKQLVLFCQPCLDLLSREPGLHLIPLDGKPGWGIWAKRSAGRLLLITPVTEATADEASHFAHTIAVGLDDNDPNAILRMSRRVYPAIILADDDLWIDLEKEPVANMALSPEESEVLESARRSESPFPLFINGRAGSGKSTILQYLFADLLFYYLSKSEARVMAPPIYLTANGELLRVARNFVERLLRSEATFTQLPEVDMVQDNLQVLDNAFREFQPYLLSLVQPEERGKCFGRPSRVTYARFRQMWFERFGKDKKALREFGPDLSWHVIRSYIKGLSSETYLEPDDYSQLPENQITVTQEAFNTVYDRVWTGWYQRVLEEDGLWDDQDLTRYVLDHDLATPLYPAVVCDEAQDFTRLELELLLRLNLFSNRTLPPNDVSRIAFAFAGDPFQTLNPTGFRWDTIKASFVEKFIFELDPARRSGRTDLNYRELKYNYRSTHKIVRFGNHIQAMRAALFHLPDLRPQTPWTIEPQSFPVVWFRANDAEFWKKFRDHASFVLIVPCNEGEEADFVQGDPILREYIRVEDGVPLNVLSPGRAKGCEYPAVIVYGFGAVEPINIMSELESPSKGATADPDKSLPLQYFINRLYVAVSRPKRRLIIVDTDQGFEKLWKFVQDEMAENSMLKRVKHGNEIWSQEIEGMTIGNPEYLTRENAGDPLENAKAFENDGLARQDAFLLRQAAQSYRSGGDMAKARECRARALEMEGQHLEAGDAYFDAGFSSDGVRCFWRAGKPGWARLCNKSATYPHLQTELEFQWACGTTLDEAAQILNRFAKRLDDAKFAGNCLGDPIWREALSALLQPLIGEKHDNPGTEIWSQLGAALDRIRAKGIAIPPREGARVYFLAGRYAEAIAIWDRSGETKGTDYDKAKASVEPYPQRLVSLAKLKLTHEILQAYAQAREVALSQEQATIVIDALCEVNRLDDAVALAWAANTAVPMLQLARQTFTGANQPTANRALHAGIILLVKQEQWEIVVSLVSAREFIPTPEWRQKQLKGWVEREREALSVSLVRALARSEKLPDAPTNLQRQLSDFLRRFLRVKEGHWRARLSVAEAGAALERCGRFTDALAFYEAVTKENFNKDEKHFAQSRWLVCKQRQAHHERVQGATIKADSIEHEIQTVMKSVGIHTLNELGQFPELQPLEIPLPIPQEQKPKSEALVIAPVPDTLNTQLLEPVVIQIGPFKVEVSRKNSRCNITQTETMETAFLKMKERRCGGEIEFTKITESHWVYLPWTLTVIFPTDTEEHLSLDWKSFGVALRVQI